MGYLPLAVAAGAAYAAETLKANVSFGHALRALKHGRRVAREGWNGKGMFIYLNKGISEFLSPDHSRQIDGVPEHMFELGTQDVVTRLPNINVHSATGRTVTGWLASQTDMLAEDWTILDDLN